MKTISEIIDERAEKIKTDAIDISYSEIVSMKEGDELIVNPDYQRLFRWNEIQQSRFIESVILRLPVPPFFVFEDDSGRFELIDGLQRVSSMMHFIAPELLPKVDGTGVAHLMLTGCDLVKELNGLNFEALDLRLRLSIKRSPIRMNVIKRQSEGSLRYDMFMRLNQGGSLLTQQEVRNCSSRLVGEHGTQFYEFLKDCASNPDFDALVGNKISPDKKSGKYHEELVLRYFAIEENSLQFGSISTDLDNFIEHVLKKEIIFNTIEKKETFEIVFRKIRASFGDDCFRYQANGWKKGKFSTSVFDALTTAVRESGEIVPAKIEEVGKMVNSTEFQANSSSGAWTRAKLEKRIKILKAALS